jgi:hypothetical protein
MSARRVDRQKKIGFNRQRTFQKAIVRLVADDGQFRKRITWAQTFGGARQEIRLAMQNLGVFFNHGRRRPTFQQSGQTKFNNQCRRIYRRGQRGELQHASVKDGSQGKVWRDATRVRAVSLRRNQWLPDPSSFFRRCACGISPVPAKAGTGSISRQLWLVRT